jgi:calpain-7
MITLGTGRLTHREEKELGLAGEHDYAVLDLKEVDSQRLMLVKNPWCDGMVWKGSHFSPPVSTLESWSQDLRGALSDTPALSPGTFWMSFEDVAQHFESLYLNWNPGLFLHRQDHHFSWTIPTIRSPGSFTHNPQYTLKTGNSKGDTVWVLLSRHFQTGEHDIFQSHPTSSSLGFISLYIFAADGHRVYLSDDALHRGAYVDSPQTLARLDASPSTTYTVVVAQHGLPLPKYSFTLSFFSRSPLAIAGATDALAHCSTHSGSWTVRTAGGNASSPTYPINPQFSLSLPSRTSLLLVLESDEPELAVHVKLVWGGGERVSTVTNRDVLAGSGDYRRGCALASIEDVEAGKYTIVCSTFEAGQLGNFRLRVGSMMACPVLPIPSEAAGRLRHRLPGLVFHDGVDRMLAPLTVTRLTRLRVVVRCLRTSPSSSSFSLPQASPRSRPLLKVSLERGQGPNKEIASESSWGEFSDAPMGVRTNDVDLKPLGKGDLGVWIVVERLGGGKGGEEVEVEVLSDRDVVVGLWGTGGG